MNFNSSRWTKGTRPLELDLMELLARGVDTAADLGTALDARPEAVEAALAWAVGQGLVTRAQMSEGEHVALTERGLTAVAAQRRIDAAISPTGQIDLSGLVRHFGAAQQAMQQGRTEAWSRSQDHVLVDDADRDATVLRLREHYAEGAVDDAGLERRVAIALTARTRGDLRSALADLEPGPAPAAGPTSATSVDVFLRSRNILKIVGTVMLVLFLLRFVLMVVF